MNFSPYELWILSFLVRMRQPGKLTSRWETKLEELKDAKAHALGQYLIGRITDQQLREVDPALPEVVTRLREWAKRNTRPVNQLERKHRIMQRMREEGRVKV